MARKKIVKKPGERDIAPDTLADYAVPKKPRVRKLSLEQPSLEQPSLEQPSLEQPSLEQPSLEQSSIDLTSVGELLFDVERRRGERRQNEQRRSGLRGHWEERRILDRHNSEYSICGKRMDEPAEELLPNPLDLPDVPLEVLISPVEIRILEEREQLERERKAQQQATQKTPSKVGKRRKKFLNNLKVSDVMNIGDRVVIGGRTMLRPGFSLVGLEGIVMPLAPQVPPGCLTILIDWQGQGYENADGDLPLFVNIPTAHLELAEDKTAQEELEPPRPVLGLVRPQPGSNEAIADEAPEEKVSRAEADQSETGQKPDKPDTGKPDVDEPDADEPEEERPRLRLI